MPKFDENEIKLLIEMLIESTSYRQKKEGIESEQYREAAKLLAKIEEYTTN